ncbi:MAG: ABC transporter permease subunit [Micromonosporaceae bacterium]|nr:ABC transporter permease subunit [Micromonosporaceae bacterium]
MDKLEAGAPREGRLGRERRSLVLSAAASTSPGDLPVDDHDRPVEPVTGYGRLDAARPSLLRRWRDPLIVVLALGVLWELALATSLLSQEYFPRVGELAGALADLLGSQTFWTSVLYTLAGWGLGLLISVPVGVFAGIAIGSHWLTYRAFRPVVEFFRPIPSIAYLPLAVVALGSGMRLTIFLVALATSWHILIQTIYGVRSVEAVTMDTATVFRFPYRYRLFTVILPSALPSIMTGVRLASTIAIVLTITAGLVVGSPGIGSLVIRAQLAGQTTGMYALIFVAGLLGWGLDILVRRVQHSVLVWHPSTRKGTP